MTRAASRLAPWAMGSAFFQFGSLTWEMTKRDVLGRYRGARLGMLWTLISPFLMLMVYTLAFGHIMKAKWPQIDGESTSSFALILFIGLIVHGFFSECFMRSPSLITSNPNYVKRIIFPVEILPWPMILSALFHAGMNLVVFAFFYFLVNGHVVATIALLPLVFLPLIVLMVGLSWALSSLAVYFRDVGQMTGPIATAMLFLSSAIMPLDAVPEAYRTVFALNPLTFIIDQARAVALWGQMPDWPGLGLYLVLALAFSYLAFIWFEVTRKGFADVL